MKNWVLFPAVICLLCLFSCSKNKDTDSGLAGKWVLIKACSCNICIDSNSVDNKQTLIFTSNGQVQVSGLVGNTEQQCSGTYTVTREYGYDNLNITLAPPGPDYFYMLPGSIIASRTATKLILDVNTRSMGPCLFQNTYVLVSK